ncbi:hypothetical protein [Parasitella parasitica]|uniref:Uncharacterized protein n=1 Tax=Parasitella parasitica TaxID=35722 RepID=A0A0B7MSB8_9FUNG|nr:hypothetical protein [Parasitella parasitica]
MNVLVHNPERNTAVQDTSALNIQQPQDFPATRIPQPILQEEPTSSFNNRRLLAPAPRRFVPQPFVVPLHQPRSSRVRRYRRCQTCSVFGCPGGQSRGTCQNKCTLCGIVWCSGRPSFPGGNCQNRL